MSAKPRVVHYTIGCHNPPEGGVEIAIRDIARMTHEKYKHIVLSSGPHYSQAEHLESIQSTARRGFVSVDGKYKDIIPNCPDTSMHFDNTTVQRIKDVKPDILIVYGDDCNAMLIPLLEIPGRKYVRLQGQYICTKSNPQNINAWQWLSQNSDGILVFQEYIQRAFERRDVPAFLISKSYDGTIFNTKERTPFVGTRYMYVGRDGNIKNIDNFIKLFKKLRTGKETLHMVGASTLSKYEKLQPDINYTGWVPHNQLSLLYKQTDFVVLPSLRETFSSVGLEALACGCILVINNVTMKWAEGLCLNGANLTTQTSEDRKFGFANASGLELVFKKCMDGDYEYDPNVAGIIKERYTYHTVQSKWLRLFEEGK